jgi:ribonuclease III
LDLVYRRPVEPQRGEVLIPTAQWLNAVFGEAIADPALFERALTHGSFGPNTYERLEFLGDRVLGMTIACWLFARFPDDQEGQLSRRLNVLVSGEVCADVARRIGVAPYIRLGKQARDDGGSNSDNILGDVMEALIGALYLDQGMATADAFIRAHWTDLVEGQRVAPRHPKSALQEWAAAQGRKAPVYDIIEQSGPHHAPRFTVRVSLGSAGQADAQGGSKQEAETAAAAAMLERLE